MFKCFLLRPDSTPQRLEKPISCDQFLGATKSKDICRGTILWGERASYFRNIKDWQKCRELCSKNAICVAWVHYGGGYYANICFLRKNVEEEYEEWEGDKPISGYRYP